MNRIEDETNSLFAYRLLLYLLRLFNQRGYFSDEDQRKKRLEEVYDICGGAEEGGAGMIKALCRWMSVGMFKKCE